MNAEIQPLVPGWEAGDLINSSPRDRAEALQDRWKHASCTSYWRFPSDWKVSEATAVCEVIAGHDGSSSPSVVFSGTEIEEALTALGAARAEAGADLPETLADLAALYAVITADGDSDDFIVDVDIVPPRLIRIVATGWADAMSGSLASADMRESLTGLPTLPYLEFRLEEIYQEARRVGKSPGSHYGLLVIRLDSFRIPGLTRLTAMILISDVVKGIFDGGESVAALGDATIAVLAPRNGELASRVFQVRKEIKKRMTADRQLRNVGIPMVKLMSLPATSSGACVLLEELGRATASL